VWWKTPASHTGLRVGKSIILGDILFIGAVETEEPGNLRTQFIDRLNQLPEWRATQYYCLSYALHDCGTGKSLSKGAGGRWLRADSLPKGEGLPRKNAKLSETFDLFFSKLRKVLRAIHPHVETHAAPTKDSRNRSSRKTNASELHLSSWDTAIQWLGRKKWIGYIAPFLLITGFLFLAVLVNHCKKEETHHKRDDHPSSHRSNH
jgi:hypothetical protein